MNIRTLTIAICLLSFSLPVQAESFNKEDALADVKAITKAFASSLKSELVAALQSGGPVNALNVCNAEAMPITSKIAAEHNAEVFRVSLKNRNPDNVPNDWQTKVLEAFDTRAADGEDIVKMASVDIVDVDDKKQVRFMKAVPTEGACLLCHGTQIAPDVQAKLAEYYPEDKATGYSLGDVRGAIVVIKDFETTTSK